MKKSFSAIVLAAGFIAGCETSPPPNVVTWSDEMTGQSSRLITDNILEDTSQSGSLVWLNASQTYGRRNRPLYYLEVRYQATPERGWLEIPVGETLTIVTDGSPMKFAGAGSGRFRRKRYGTLIENAIYEVTLDDLKNIANAQKVRVQVRGSKGTVERDFSLKNSENFREFVREIRSAARGS